MMRYKSWFFLIFFVMFSGVWAASQDKSERTFSSSRTTMPGRCEIELVNGGNFLLRVNGTLDDGFVLDPFYMTPYDKRPYYITLMAGGYCHPGMNLYIDTVFGNISLFNGYVARNSCVHIHYSMLNRQFHVNMTAR